MRISSPLPIKALVACLALGIFAPAAYPVDLISAWGGAREHDPQFAGERAGAEAGQTQYDQARALWKPTVTASGGIGMATANTVNTGAQFSTPAFGRSDNVDFRTSIEHGNDQQWALTARQPIYDRERLAQGRQLEAGASAAEAQARQAYQEALLRTADRYFDVVIAERTLAVIKEQRLAVENAAREINDRFALGDTPVTDTHEAKARVEAIAAEEMVAQNQLEMAQSAFYDQTGLAPRGLIGPAGENSELAHSTLDEALDRATHSNPAVAQHEARVTAAREEIAKHGALTSPTVDIVARSSGERISGDGEFGPARTQLNNQYLGVQFNVPLYTGGMRSAKKEQAIKELERAEAELSATRQETSRAARMAWLNLKASTARLAALDASRKASAARLEATRLAHQIGDRTTLDLLNAENDHASAELALLRARVERLMNALRLAAATGDLNEDALQRVNTQLAATGTP